MSKRKASSGEQAAAGSKQRRVGSGGGGGGGGGGTRVSVPPTLQAQQAAAAAAKQKQGQARGGGGGSRGRAAQPPPLQHDAAAAAAADARPSSQQQPQQPPQQQPPQRFKNREKVLVVGSRGITYRSRHLMADVLSLLPHAKKDVKLDTKSDRGVLNEAADEKGCGSVLFFEARKRQDLYLWMAKSPGGPTAKFLVLNVHTMDELKLTGNHLKGSRPVLSFDAAFDEQPHLQLLKEQLAHVFATPRRHHRAKPFFDHVISFTLADGCIWLRNYQVVVPLDKAGGDAADDADADATAGGGGRKAKVPQKQSRPPPSAGDVQLVEVGPRAALRPIRIFEGSFGGRVLYDNPEYVSPNVVRRLKKAQKAGKYQARVAAREKRRAHEQDLVLPLDEVEEVFRRG